MAQIRGKQLRSNLTGSFLFSGSYQKLFSDQVVIGSVPHPSASLTIEMQGKSGIMLPLSTTDPAGMAASEIGMTYYNTEDTLLKLWDGISWIPAGDINTKNSHPTMSADINNAYADSSMIFRIDGVTDSDVKFRLRSDDSHHLTGSVNVSGSIVATTLPTGSTSITSNNTTAGYPVSNRWQSGLDGSYFNRFVGTTHISEILRFMSGVLSHSLDVRDVSPNTLVYSSIDTNETSLGSTDSINGHVPQNFNSTELDYLNAKGFANVGSTLFSGISPYYQNGNSYYIDFDSNSGGTTQVSSSTDTELFGLGSLSSPGVGAEFRVKVVATQSFSDVSSNTSPNQSSNTYTTQSYKDLSTSAFGTSNGVTLSEIFSVQPAVIPNEYQDGRFINAGGTSLTGTLTRKYHASETSFTSVSSSGYYRFHDLKVGISSGSQPDYTFKNGSTKNRFWAPTSTIDSALGDNNITYTGTTVKNLTATSRSLSGTPYLLDATWETSTKISNLFTPLYANSPSLVDCMTNSVGINTVSISGDTVSTNGGTIQTGTAVYDSTGATERDTDTVPYYNDIVLKTGSISFDSGNNENISQTGFGDTTFQTRWRTRDRNSSYDNDSYETIYYHEAGTFSQPASSGSLGIYGRAQGYDGGSLTGTSEAFTGEDFRIQLADNVQAFNGTAWTTTYDVSRPFLSDYDLQVKPGFLVDPGGTYRYWYPASYGSGTYKYYIRRFQISGTKISLTVNVGKTLINWNSTTNGVSAVILFKSSGNGSGANASLGVARIYDPSDLSSNVIETGVAADNFKNPFTTAIDLYGNIGGSLNSTTYTVPLRNANGMYLDNSDNELYVIVRYKGDPSPVTSIALNFS